MTTFEARWRDHWARLGLAGDPACLASLLDNHDATGRHYHTQQHLAECLDLLEEVFHLAAHPGAVAIALWFHDAVYVPQAQDNEARSAQWAGEALHAAGADPATIAQVQGLIMATAHHDAAGDSDTQLVVDIDLAILGAAPARFAQYEQQIRAEYAAVPDATFRDKRRVLLARFLARPVLYATPALRARLEEPARVNLQRAVGSA